MNGHLQCASPEPLKQWLSLGRYTFSLCVILIKFIKLFILRIYRWILRLGILPVTNGRLVTSDIADLYR